MPARLSGVAGWDDVRRIALALPETNERPSRGNVFWRVRDRGFAGPISVAELEEPIAGAWLCGAPRRLAQAYLDGAR